MINGILGKLCPDTGILSHKVITDLMKQGEADSKEVALADENCGLWVGCTELYLHLHLKLPVEEDWVSSDQWVVGVVTASMDEIKESVKEKKLRGFDFDDLWATLEDAEAVAVVGGVVILPHLAGKVAVLDELLRHLDRQRAQLEKLEPVQNDLLQQQDELSRRVAETKKSLENVLGVTDS